MLWNGHGSKHDFGWAIVRKSGEGFGTQTHNFPHEKNTISIQHRFLLLGCCEKWPTCYGMATGKQTTLAGLLCGPLGKHLGPKLTNFASKKTLFGYKVAVSFRVLRKVAHMLWNGHGEIPKIGWAIVRSFAEGFGTQTHNFPHGKKTLF